MSSVPLGTDTDTGAHGGRGRPLRRFLLHYLEMLVAMGVGMIALGTVIAMAVAGLGVGYSHARYPEWAALEMAFTMSAGMAFWMRFRGHRWAPILEMSAAMFVPAIALVPLLRLDVVGGESVLMLMHVSMLPLMLVAMLWRREEYTG